MPQRTFKFGSADSIKFVEIYKTYECLWNMKHIDYKNRHARNAALVGFSRELGVKNFGARDITMKIKNMRSQYLQERKKVKLSLEAGDETVYVPKLPWYNYLDSFLRNTSEFHTTILKIENSSPSTSHVSDTLCKIEEIENIETFDTLSDTVEYVPKPTQSKKIKTRKLDNELPKKKLDIIHKKSRQNEDDLDIFGKYVASSLRNLNKKNMIFAQDEIQATLSKFKLKNLKETAPTSDTQSSESDSDS